MTTSRGGKRRCAALGVIVMSMPAARATDLLYGQNTSCSNTYLSSENIATVPYYQSRVADDFLVPAGATWSVEQVAVAGSYFGEPQTPASFDVFFYDDAAGAPGNSVEACANAGATFSTLGNLFTVTLQNTCSLTGGNTYWVSAQANLAATPNTDWGWRERTVKSGNLSRVEYPGRSAGAQCLSWGLKTDCVGTFESAYPDQCFSLLGASPVIFSNGFEGTSGGTCADLTQLENGSTGFFWTSQSSGSVTYGDGTLASSVDFKAYTAVWNEGTANPWPGTSGLSVRPALFGSVYLTEMFTADGGVSGTVKWVNNKTGPGYVAASNAASYSISTCPGDFGQPGTQLGANCSADISSTAGLTAAVSNTPQPGVCTLAPGQTYYLNILQASLAGVAQSGAASPSCSSNCAPWTVRQ